MKGRMARKIGYSVAPSSSESSTFQFNNPSLDLSSKS